MTDVEFAIDPEVRMFCGPLFFTTSIQTPSGTISNNASFGLVHTGQRKLLVTCRHVWEDFKKLRAETPKLMFAVCLDMGNPIVITKPELSLVDEDRRCDLVTFDIGDLGDVCSKGGLDFYNLKEKRPPKIEAGDYLYLIGFPGKGRTADGKSVGFPRQGIGVMASEVGKSNFFADVQTLNKQANDFGGISGAPCFLVRRDKPIIRLVGFAKGFSDSMRKLQFTYAAFIGSDGMIRSMC